MENKSIGIQFYGRRNQRRYFGLCNQCHQQVSLASYQTQRWFGIRFLPILPLGSRHILDHCPACHNLRQFSPDEWEQTKKKSVTDAAEEMKASPDDPAPAIRLHGLLIAFGKSDEAHELETLLQQRFADHPDAQACVRSPAGDHPFPSSEGGQGFKRFAAVLLLLLALLFGISNHYIALNRVLHVVNGWQSPITIRIDDQTAVTVPAGNVLPIRVAEGARKAVVSGATERTIPFSVGSNLAERWLGDRYFILNPGGAALLITETTQSHPQPAIPGELDYQFHLGTEFLEGVADYVFADFPSREPTSDGASKRRLAVLATPPAELFYQLMGNRRPLEAMSIAEWHLRLHPDQADLLGAYINVAMASGQQERMRTYLMEGTRARPVRVQWHRVYQSLAEGGPAQETLVSEYDQFLSAEPRNSALLYLRGRLSSRMKEANPYYEKAIQSDPNNAFAHHALGYNAASRGNWADARKHLARAAELRPNDEQMLELFYLARFALQEFEPLEKELSADLAEDPLRLTAVRRLSEVLIELGKTNALQKLSQDHQRTLDSRFASRADAIHAQLQAHISYSLGDFAQVETLARADRSIQGRMNLFYALTEQGRFDEATNAVSLLQLQEPFHVLAFALAEDSAKRTLSAVRHLGVANQGLIDGRAGYPGAAELLARPAPPSLEEALDLTLAPQSKAILLVALAQRFPDRRPEFLAAAQQLNVSREFPYHLINRLAQAPPAGG